MTASDTAEESVAADGPASDATQEANAPSQASDERESLRQLIIRAHPDVVPELIRGATLGEMLASVPEARDAYARVAATASSTRAAPPESVPAGSGVRTAAVEIEGLSALSKIRAGLRRRA